MREIKFKGLTTYGKEWVFGCLTRESEKVSFITEDYIELETYEVCNESVGQFTGLKDKNGVEIYEGDICKHDGGLIAQIVFWEGAFIFNKYYIHDYSLSNFAPCRTFEVIGNIHTNSELLK